MDGWRQVEGRLLELHSALLRRDPVASAEFAELALPALQEALSRKYRGVDQDIVLGACGEAILKHCQSPDTWDPERGRSLPSYLWMSAEGDLKNSLEKARRQTARELSVEPVELSKFDRNITVDTVMFEGDVEDVVARYAHLLPEAEMREVLKLMAMGERDERVFSVAMGISSLPEAQRRREVKRMKDRIVKRLQRGVADEE